jgi:hypothetical protein
MIGELMRHLPQRCSRQAADRRQSHDAQRWQDRGWTRPALRPLAVVLLVALMLGSVPAIGAAEPTTARFVSSWDTTKIEGTTISLPFGGAVAATVNWGDGTVQEVTGGWAIHSYAQDGTYTVTTTGTFATYGSFNGAQLQRNPALLSVDVWDDTQTTSLTTAFAGASNLLAVAQPPATVTRMNGMTPQRP